MARGNTNDNDKMVEERLKSLDNKNEYLKSQLEYLIRLISGDETLNKLNPTGMVHELKEVKDKLNLLDKDSRKVVDWFNEKDKRKYIINVDLIAWGKVIAWFVGIAAAIFGILKWFTAMPPNNK